MEQVVHSRSCGAGEGSTAGSRTSLKAVSSCGTQLHSMCICSLGRSPAARTENDSCWKGALEVSSLVPFSKQDQEGQVTRSFSSWVLKAFKDVNPTVFQSPHPSLTTFMVKKCFHLSNQTFLCPHLCPWPLIPPWPPLRRVWCCLP